MTSPAPLFEDIAQAPPGGVAHWVTTEDGVRIRVAVWRGGDRGTVLLFPGRTEYIEKYGHTATELVNIGFSVAIIDWRGQGLAHRFLKEPLIGHVESFTDFQHDVRAMIELVRSEGLPETLYMIAHSMGGCIGFRTCIERDDIASVIFTGPMWGIAATPPKRALGWTVSSLSRAGRFSQLLTPGTALETYVRVAAYEDNQLTTDPEMFAHMQAQLNAHPELALGGPSLHWVNEALRECRRLSRMPSPSQNAEIYLGTNERIVDVEAVHDRAARWQNATLHLVEGGEHEILMELPETRARVIASADALFR